MGQDNLRGMIFVAFAAAGGCDSKPAPKAAAPAVAPAAAPAPAAVPAPAPALPDTDEAFRAAVRSAAVYQSEHVRELKPLTFDSQGMATVSTLTSSPFTVGPTQLSEDAWVTQVPEVQQLCTQFPASTLTMELRQLLGLHPHTKIVDFVEMQVQRADIFRPAANPDPTTTRPCDPNDPPPPSHCGELFPKSATDAHRLWIADWIFDAYELSSDPKVPTGYPWTRLGYTFNWKPGADRYGASEFVVREGAKVQVTAVTPYVTYCTPSNPPSPASKG
jgi:hypothetical protein